MIFKIDNPIYDYCKTVCIVGHITVSPSKTTNTTFSIEKRMKGKPVVSHKMEWKWKPN